MPTHKCAMCISENMQSSFIYLFIYLIQEARKIHGISTGLLITDIRINYNKICYVYSMG